MRAKKMSHANLSEHIAAANLLELDRRSISQNILLGEPNRTLQSQMLNKNRKVNMEVLEMSDSFKKVFEMHYKLQNIPQGSIF
jgi:hypothetical protein